MLEIIINILIVLLIIGFLVFIHELGHFLTAKFFKVKVDAFAVGLGPKIFSFKRGETEYRLNILPIGGYVKILGEGDEEVDGKSANDPRNFKNIAKWKQIIVLLAGVTMNLLFSVVVYYGLLFISDFKWQVGPDLINLKPVVGEISQERIGEVKYVGLVDDGSAKKSNFPSEGEITKIDGKTYSLSSDVRDYFLQRKGEEITVNVCNGNDCADYTTTLSSEGKIGMLIPDNFSVYIDYTESKLIAGFGHVLNLSVVISEKLGSLFSEAKQSGDYSTVANNVAGPVGIYLIVEVLKEYGFLTILGLTADLSFTLVIMNLLPIPALDGGRVLLIILESIMGRFWSKRAEMWAINISFFLLLLLMVAVMFKDIFFFNDLRELLN